MKAVLICPAERPAVQPLADVVPLVNLQILSKPLIVYWLEHLVTLGAKEVRVLAADRPEQIRALLGDGSRWGLKIEVLPEQRELNIPEARAKYRKNENGSWLADPNDFLLADHFPGLPGYPLFASYEGWFTAVQAWMTRIAAANQVGAREMKPGVWVGLRARIAANVQLRAPCWIGSHTMIGPDTVIGPMAIIEDRSMVEANVEVTDSVIGPETFVGELTELRNSLAHGSTLINWRSGSCTTIPDAFLMCSLGQRGRRLKSGNLIGKVAALAAMILTLPFALVPFLRAKLASEHSLRSRVAVRAQTSAAPSTTHTLVYYELANCTGWLRLWPQLWNIVKGDFAWVGNRPLSPAEVTELTNDFERLWLAAPIGLISLADAEGSTEPFSDETRVCASLYAVQANWRLDLQILARTFLGLGRRSLATP
jgi:hypothetical protein